MSDVMLQYCKICDSNRLVKAVVADLEVRVFLVGCHTLGIIGKTITGPLWGFLVSDKLFVEVVSVYQELTRNLGAWAVDASDLVDGSGKAFTGAVIHTGTPVFDSLFRPSESDENTKIALQLLCTTFHTFMLRAWAPYFEGGELAAVDEATTTNLPKTNVLSEHDFGQLDRFLQEKPNATTLSIKIMVMLANVTTKPCVG